MVDIEVYSKSKSKSRQPAADWLCKLPALLACSGPSMSGKGVLIQNLIMNPRLYHDSNGDSCFDEVHIFSGSAKLDINLDKVRRYCEDVLKMDPDKNPCLHDGFNEGEVREILQRQRKAVRKARREQKILPPNVIYRR